MWRTCGGGGEVELTGGTDFSRQQVPGEIRWAGRGSHERSHVRVEMHAREEMHGCTSPSPVPPLYTAAVLCAWRMHGCMETGRMGAWKQGCMGAWVHGNGAHGRMEAGMHGCMGAWKRGSSRPTPLTHGRLLMHAVRPLAPTPLSHDMQPSCPPSHSRRAPGLLWCTVGCAA